jgi:hypothetical protein
MTLRIDGSDPREGARQASTTPLRARAGSPKGVVRNPTEKHAQTLASISRHLALGVRSMPSPDLRDVRRARRTMLGVFDTANFSSPGWATSLRPAGLEGRVRRPGRNHEGHAARLGKDYWTTFEASADMTFGTTKVRPARITSRSPARRRRVVVAVPDQCRQC